MRNAIVTGGTSGIGLAVAQQLLKAGFNVGVFSQSAPHVAKADDMLTSEFGSERILARQVDLRDAAGVPAFFTSVEERWGAIDTLVCNAGYSPKRQSGRVPFAEIEASEWQQVLAINLTGTMRCCQLALPGMKANGFGRIVMIGSVAGRTLPRIAGASYTASKAGVSGLARALVADTWGDGITINTVAPGRILTEMTGPQDSPANKSALERIPVGRLGQPEDVARTVAFLVSEDAGFINGSVIDVNGGEFVPL
jgi:3-oxoacyl-[acyl-carrier protein] reductase|tara:strand:- start:13211 stop:13969 length:759 start_codon:yes stop_codon:yes gene_type:complete